jgi:phosphoribosylformylglycinamidine cyclo-ligase
VSSDSRSQKDSAESAHGHAGDAYAKAGVRYDVIDPGKRFAQERALGTAGSLAARGFAELLESRGESAYVVDVGDFYLSSVTEALGTKNLIADATRALTGRSHYDTIAQDTVATVLNDLASVGGVPVSLTAYWGTGSSEWFADQQRMRDLSEGWAQACLIAGCSWGGGETQTITGIIEPNAMNLAGSAVGVIRPKSHLLTGSRIQTGDTILIAPASGLHANGATLARKIASELPQGYATPVPGDARARGFGEVLLDPTPLYGPLVEALQRAGLDLHYAVHVTGHGWRKLMRAERELAYVVSALPPRLPVFDFIQQQAGMSDEAMYGTFNMGAGFALYLPARDVPEALRLAESVGFSLMVAGRVEAGAKKVSLQPLGITFDGASLQIRA